VPSVHPSQEELESPVKEEPAPIVYTSSEESEESEEIIAKTKFPDLDDDGKEYATKIARNVVEKLKISLGIPEGDTSHWQLMKFFTEKFEKKKKLEFSKEAPDMPDLKILSAEVFGHGIAVKTKEEKVSR
jgi:hypothetical protein